MNAKLILGGLLLMVLGATVILDAQRRGGRGGRGGGTRSGASFRGGRGYAFRGGGRGHAFRGGRSFAHRGFGRRWHGGHSLGLGVGPLWLGTGYYDGYYDGSYDDCYYDRFGRLVCYVPWYA